ncbi:MAG TPA: sigma-70 family RNA polymerase sigma factor [Parafilimonas sp.]|nr:sigma-70 family RNA polymerase sigma factor [Parafilimonas sp.]
MIDAIRNGDSKAFEQCYILFREKLFGYFLKKTCCKEDAKDLLQITFCRLWQYRKSLSNEYLPEQHLFHIARTVFIDYLRRENKQEKIKTKVSLQDARTLSPEHLFEFDLYKRLQKILSAMPFIRKQVFVLNKIEGYSYKEIAGMLSIPVKSVDNNLARALKQLRSVELVFIILFLNGI